MKKCVLIIPYFGKFHNYFQLFLNSCGQNPEFDWLIFTDDRRDFVYPDNVRVHYCEFRDIQELFQSKFDFPIRLNDPRKLCDYKPAYGYVFQEYISQYDFWGHCDCDLIFGKLSHFITDVLLTQYDKLFTQGHLILYKNGSEEVKRFMLPYNGMEIYKEMFQQDAILAFNEEYRDKNVNRIYKQNGFSVFETEFSANIDRRYSDFRIVHYDAALQDYLHEDPRKNSGFVWRRGELRRYYVKLAELRTPEFMYIHLQGRPMKVQEGVAGLDTYKIIPNIFLPIEEKEITMENINQIKWNTWNLQWFRIKKKNLSCRFEGIANKIRRK